MELEHPQTQCVEAHDLECHVMFISRHFLPLLNRRWHWDCLRPRMPDAWDCWICCPSFYPDSS